MGVFNRVLDFGS